MQNAEFFVGWGTLSLVNAGLAQAKGRNGFAWWIGSVILGPVATLLIVLLPKLTEAWSPYPKDYLDKQ